MAYYNSSNDADFYPSTAGFEEHPFLNDPSAVDIFRDQDHEIIGNRLDMPAQERSPFDLPTSLTGVAGLGKHNSNNFID